MRKIIMASICVLTAAFFMLPSIVQSPSAGSWHTVDSWQFTAVTSPSTILVLPVTGTTIEFWNFLYGVGSFGAFSAVIKILNSKRETRKWKRKCRDLYRFLLWRMRNLRVSAILQ